MAHNYSSEYNNLEAHYQKCNDDYIIRCGSQESYDELGSAMPNNSWNVHPAHLARRGKYEQYPAHAVTLGKDKRDRPIFIQCACCLKRYCTDGWLPFGYGSFNDRMRLVGDGSDRRPYLYFCKYESKCLQASEWEAKQDKMGLVKSLNYRCTYTPR